MAKARKPRPSFNPATSPATREPEAATGWVYRSGEPPAESAVPAPLSPSPPSTSGKTETAKEIIASYWKWAAVAGVLPPLVDMAVVTGIQVKMIADLAELYYPDVEFKNEWGKSVVGALVGSVSPPFLAHGGLWLLGPVLKVVPVVGIVASLVAIPAFNAATTRALGTVFLQHFELGGTLFDFDPDTIRARFRKEFEAAARQPAP